MEHLIADHFIVYAGTVGQHHTTDPIPPGCMMRHGTAGLIEYVSRMGTDGEETEIVHF